MRCVSAPIVKGGVPFLLGLGLIFLLRAQVQGRRHFLGAAAQEMAN